MGKKLERTADATAQEVLPDNRKNENAVPKISQCVYIGPTIKGTITKNTIFASGIPLSAQEKIKEHPILMHLFVPIKDLQEVNRQMKANGRYKVLYDNALKELNKEA